jgi:CDP-4-dehydro-6-deoxyglucose reductase
VLDEEWQVRVSLSKSNRSFSVAPDQPVLDAALDASLNLPHSCKGGNCGACRARLLQGEVHYPHGRPLGLSDAEAADGFVLLCQARARTDLLIETVDMRTPDQAVIKRLPARIERALPLSHDVLGLHLRLPVAEEFNFEAGQYIDILLPGGRRRSFSIASAPHDSRVLELHVRRVAGGEFTDRLFAPERRPQLLNIEGPLGQFVYRPPPPATAGAATGTAAPLGQPSATAAPPMLMIGGGTGIAPLLSMLRHVVENRIERDISVYWGVRSEPDLYAHAALLDLAQRAACVRYTPVLSEPSPAWAGLRGWVHEAALREIAPPDTAPRDIVQSGHESRHEVYAAGPPAMIEAVRRECRARGVGADRLFFDSFDYAPDTLARQRTSAVTKS